jgi:hypothetical protein
MQEEMAADLDPEYFRQFISMMSGEETEEG